MQIKNAFIRCFHSLGLAVLPILGMYANDVDKFVLTELVLPIILSMLAVMLGLIVVTRYTQDIERSALAVSITYFAIVFYAPVASGIIGEVVYGWAAPNNWFVFVWMIFWCAEAYLLAFKFKHPAILRIFGNVFVAVLLFFIVSQILNYHLFIAPGADLIVMNQDLNAVEKKQSELPDIYYIVLDSYAGNDTLRDLYGYDNSEFTNFLIEKGFYLADKSRTNYPLTYFSLASSLNMGYLALGPNHSSSFNSFSPLVDLISDNLVAKKLKALGYRTIAFSSGYMATEMRKFDNYISDGWICREFLNSLAKQTILVSCNTDTWNLARCQADAHRNNIRKVLAKIPLAANSPEPAFVFAHILAPHAPFVFNRDGSSVDLPYFNYSDGIYLRRYMDTKIYRQQFGDQLRYMNVLIKDCVGRILEDSTRKKVIIIQADHGPASDVDYTSLERSNPVERMSILNAIYLPDGNYEGFRPDLSPVNNFRIVFKNALKQNLELLPNRSHFLTFKDLYVFKDITDILK